MTCCEILRGAEKGLRMCKGLRMTRMRNNAKRQDCEQNPVEPWIMGSLTPHTFFTPCALLQVVTCCEILRHFTNFDGSIRANRFADSRVSSDSRESFHWFQGFPNWTPFLRIALWGGGGGLVDSRESIRANRPDSRCESPGHLSSRNLWLFLSLSWLDIFKKSWSIIKHPSYDTLRQFMTDSVPSTSSRPLLDSLASHFPEAQDWRNSRFPFWISDSSPASLPTWKSSWSDFSEVRGGGGVRAEVSGRGPKLLRSCLGVEISIRNPSEAKF